MPYFRRAGHAALLVAATVFTYGIGGLAYWLLKRRDRICPSCGLSWGPAHLALAYANEGADLQHGSLQVPDAHRSHVPGERDRASVEHLPRSGLGRRVAGVVIALTALLMLGGGILEGELSLIVASAVFGAGGAASFAWGWRAQQQRRAALLRDLQRRVLRLAHDQGGRLTATDVASTLDLSLSGAERVLLSLDDGFRVRSDVTDEGLLVFDFPEIRLRGESDRALGGESVEGA